MSLPKNFDSQTSLVQDYFLIPEKAPAVVNTHFLEEQNKRIESLIWLLLSINEKGSTVDMDDTDLSSLLSQILTMTTQVRQMFEHCEKSRGVK